MPELPLPYVPVDPMISDSARMGDFVDRLELYDDPAREWYVVSLFLYFGRKPSLRGVMAKPTPRKVASACRWPGKPAELLEALTGAQWLVPVPPEVVAELLELGEEAPPEGALYLEGWERHGGKVLAGRDKWRKDKADYRDRMKREREAGNNVRSDVHETSTRTSDRTSTEKGGVVRPESGVESETEKGEGRRVKGEEHLIDYRSRTSARTDGHLTIDPDPIVATRRYGHEELEGILGNMKVEIRGTSRTRLKQMVDDAGGITGQELTDARRETVSRTGKDGENGRKGPPLEYMLDCIDSAREAAARPAQGQRGGGGTQRPRHPPEPPPPTDSAGIIEAAAMTLGKACDERDADFVLGQVALVAERAGVTAAEVWELSWVLGHRRREGSTVALEAYERRGEVP